MSEHTEFLVALRHPQGNLFATAIVESEDEGEQWCCRTRPDDGTQLDYLRFDLSPQAALLEAAAPKLLVALRACKPLIERCASELYPVAEISTEAALEALRVTRAAIAKAKGG